MKYASPVSNVFHVLTFILFLLLLLLLQILYLRQFPMLKTLNIANNPVSREDKDGFKQYVAAFLPNVEFLDYRLLDQQTVSSHASTIRIDDLFRFSKNITTFIA